LPQQLSLPEFHPQDSIREHIRAEALRWEGYRSMRYVAPHLGLGPLHTNPDQQWFDCSGYATYVLRTVGARLGIPIPESLRHTDDWYEDQEITIPIHFGQHRTGDLIFFSYGARTAEGNWQRRRGVRVSHMGIVLDYRFYIHALGNNNTQVKVTPIRDEPIEIVEMNQIYNHNPIGFKRLAFGNGRWKNWQEI
jgi:cell wall-associated NlpC family hydrolase